MDDIDDLKATRRRMLATALRTKRVPQRERAKYLAERCGNGVSYWSGLLGGSRSFGEKTARRIESCLGLARLQLDGTPTRPAYSEAAEAIAAAYDRLPNASAVDTELRKRVYWAVMDLLDRRGTEAATTARPLRDAQPTTERARSR